MLIVRECHCFLHHLADRTRKYVHVYKCTYMQINTKYTYVPILLITSSLLYSQLEVIKYSWVYKIYSWKYKMFIKYSMLAALSAFSQSSLVGQISSLCRLWCFSFILQEPYFALLFFSFYCFISKVYAFLIYILLFQKQCLFEAATSGPLSSSFPVISSMNYWVLTYVQYFIICCWAFCFWEWFCLCLERVQNEPPQNVPLWHMDYFELKSVKAQKTWENFFTPSYLPKRI